MNPRLPRDVALAGLADAIASISETAVLDLWRSAPD